MTNKQPLVAHNRNIKEVVNPPKTGLESRQDLIKNRINYLKNVSSALGDTDLNASLLVQRKTNVIHEQNGDSTFSLTNKKGGNHFSREKKSLTSMGIAMKSSSKLEPLKVEIENPKSIYQAAQD